jgi:radical SAM superfamily enzyme YgiQ (UPF0313 family)
VLLLNPPGLRPYIRDNYCSYSAKANYFWEPIDLLVQSAWLGDRHDLAVLDAIAERRSPDDVVRFAREGRFDAVVSLTGSVSLDEDRALFARLKDAGVKTIAASGDLTLTRPAAALAAMPALDAALLDYTTPELAAFLAGDRAPFAALAYRDGSAVVEADPGRKLPPEMDYPVPRHELFPLARYRISTSVDRRFVTCVASLGCNFHCPFCICSIMDPRPRTVDSLLAELRAVRRMGVREVYFYDPNFTGNKARCLAMLGAMAQEKLDLVFSCNSHITVSEEVLDALVRAGCHTVMFGIENASEEILRRYSKGITRERIRATLDRCHKRGLRTLGYFLIGLPGETEATVRATIDFARSLPLSYASFNLPSPVEGTALYEEAEAMGALNRSDHNLDRSREVSVSLSGIPDAKLLELKRTAYRRFYLRPWFLVKTIARLYPRRKWGYFLQDVAAFLRRNFI